MGSGGSKEPQHQLIHSVYDDSDDEAAADAEHKQKLAQDKDQAKGGKAKTAADLLPPAQPLPELAPLEKEWGALCLSARLADVVFVVGREKEHIYAHKMLLSARSSEFDAMFVDPACGDTIAFPALDAAAFRVMLQSVYTDRAAFDDSNVHAVLGLAQKFRLYSLGAMCVRYLHTTAITVDNACQLLEVAGADLKPLWDTTEGDGVSHAALHFIERNADAVLASPGFVTLTRDSVRRIVSSAYLHVTYEHYVLQALVRWATAELQRAYDAMAEGTLCCPSPATSAYRNRPENVRRTLETEPHATSIAAAIAGADAIANANAAGSGSGSDATTPLLWHVRYPLISTEHILAHVAPTKLFTATELEQFGLQAAAAAKASAVPSANTGLSRRPAPALRGDHNELKSTELAVVHKRPRAEVEDDNTAPSAKLAVARDLSSDDQLEDRRRIDAPRSIAATATPAPAPAPVSGAASLGAVTNMFLPNRLCRPNDFTFDVNGKSEFMALSARNMTAEGGGRNAHSYVFGTKTFTTGVHAWRTYFPVGTWVFMGVAQRNLLVTCPVGDRSFGHPSAWGYSNRGQTYDGGLNRLKPRHTNYNHRGNDWRTGPQAHVDVRLNCEAGTIEFCAHPSAQRHKLVEMPQKLALQGWTPHWNVWSGTTIRVEVIPPHHFGNNAPGAAATISGPTHLQPFQRPPQPKPIPPPGPVVMVSPVSPPPSRPVNKTPMPTPNKTPLPVSPLPPPTTSTTSATPKLMVSPARPIEPLIDRHIDEEPYDPAPHRNISAVPSVEPPAPVKMRHTRAK